MRLGGGRWAVREYVYGIVILSAAMSVIFALTPEGRGQGLKKHIRLISSICLLCVLIEPATELIDRLSAMGEDISGSISDSENGLYMSVVLRPRISADKCVAITVAAAVAVAEAIEELSKKECLIKWVNDIFIGEKKCCGILTEASVDFESGGLQYAILGIGVNICPPLGGFDSSIEDIACGIFEDTCPSGFKSRLCSMIVNKFFDYYERLEDKDYIDIYRRKSNIIGKTVDVYVGNEIISGVAVDIDENANLIVKDEQGTVRSFNSGEARVRRAERNEER